MGLFSTVCLAGVNESLAQMAPEKAADGLIVKAEEGEIRYIGNKRKAKVQIKVAKTPEYTPEISLLTEEITPGDGIPIHKHLNEEEFLFVQQGKIEITLGDNVQMGAAGDLIFVPKCTLHGFHNKSKNNVVMFFGYSPAGFEDYFRAIGTVNKDESLGFTAEDWIRTNEKFGIVYKG